MSDTPELDELLAANREARNIRRERLELEADTARDVVDRIAHPHEDDEARDKRRAQEAERARLARLGVTFR